jgi:HNH endonuclease
MKCCIRCHQSKPLDDFSNYTRYADGKHRYCKVCHRANVTASRRRSGTKPQVILPIAVRFWSHVHRCLHIHPCPYCCWEWQKGRDQDGYGKFTIRPGQMQPAHRFAYSDWHNIMLTSAILVCHHCDNPSCCNPLHLWLGTHADNHRDSGRKGRAGWQKPGAKPPHIFGEAHHLAKLTEEQVREIRSLYQQGISSIKLASMYDVSKQSILEIIHNRTWKHIL